ncbi:MAG TPA: hypothetical protein VGM90_28230 [Kofleriaceae bacterium]|jgi:hypothetical protein
MKRLTGLVLGVAAVLAGCGDNSKECGTGTTDVDGVCTGAGSGSGAICGDGTMLDADTGMCVIDPASCQGGTVLIAGDCVDPTAGLTADVTEGAEPNGLGVIEDSDAPAGQFDLKAIGGGAVVLQGNLNPHPDANDDGSPEPDVDSYLFEVSGPTLLDISVDGVGGISGAFALLPDPGDDQLANYIRLGLNFTGDTSKRQMYLPKAGIYLLAIGDSRTIRSGDPAGDANDKYYVSIEQKALPTATSLTLTAGAAQATGTITNGEVDVYSANIGDGVVEADLQTYDNNLTGELIYTVGPALRGLADETHGIPDTAAVVSGAAAASDVPLFIVDYVSNTSSTAVDYRLRVRSQATMALPANGSITQANPDNSLGDLAGLNRLSIDTTSADQLVGLELTFDTDVTADIFDANGNSLFSFNELDANTTFTHYKGVVRLPTAGRYYVVYYSPLANVGDPIQVTSKFTNLTSQTLTYNTPVTAVAPGEYNAVVYDYTLGTEPWQLVTAAANAASGGAVVHIYGVDDTYGTLSNLTIDDAGTAETLTPDQSTIAEIDAAGGGNAAQGVITPLALPNVLIVAETTNSAGTFDLKTEKRVYTDEGDHAPPYTHTDSAVVLPSAGGFVSDSVRYLVKTTPGSTVTITATPTALLNVNINALNSAESVIASAPAKPAGQAETLVRTAGSTGYVAFQVAAPAATPAVLGNTFDLAITIAAPPPPPAKFFTVTPSTTTYMNICGVGSTDITPAPEARDDGFTTNQTISGFNFYGGADRPAFKVATNGYLTFDTAAADSFTVYNFDAVPSAEVPDFTIAPFYSDIVNARICTRVDGTKTTVQWTGIEYGQGFLADQNVAFQVIMNSADDTFELVYAPYTHSGNFDAGGVMKNWTDATDGANGQALFDFLGTVDVAGKAYKFTKTP